MNKDGLKDFPIFLKPVKRPHIVKGSYCILIKINKNTRIKIGSLGFLEFPKGRYVYVGSGMNSLEHRIKRHLNKEKKIFWHIDYLLDCPSTDIMNVFYKESDKKQECDIAQSVIGEPIIGFGSSDCSCKSHLFKVSDIFFKKQWDFKTWE